MPPLAHTPCTLQTYSFLLHNTLRAMLAQSKMQRRASLRKQRRRNSLRRDRNDNASASERSIEADMPPADAIAEEMFENKISEERIATQQQAAPVQQSASGDAQDGQVQEGTEDNSAKLQVRSSEKYEAMIREARCVLVVCVCPHSPAGAKEAVATPFLSWKKSPLPFLSW